MRKHHEVNAASPIPTRSRAWPAFARELAGVLARLTEDQYLVVQAKRSNRFVQFVCQGAHGVRAEVVSNQYLPQHEQLDDARLKRLLELGWRAPTGSAESSTPELDPDGSPNFFVEHPVPVPCETLAALAVDTLVEALRVPHPGFLEYESGGEESMPLVHPELGLRYATRSTPADGTANLAEQLLATLKESTGLKDLAIDEDGDVRLRHASLAVFVRLVGDPPSVRIRSPLVLEVEATPVLFEKINALNAQVGALHFFVDDDCIWAMAEVQGAPFVPEHVARALEEFCQICDGIDVLLRSEFGGRTPFEGDMTSLTMQ